MPKAQFRRSLCLFSHRCPLGGVFVGYTRGIHGVFMGYTYVSGMCRVCIGYVSGMCRRRRGAKQGMLLTTDEHGFARKHEIYILGSVKVSEVQWSIHNRGKMFLDGRYTNHGRARMGTEKTEDIIKDNIDNLRPNQYYLGAKREICQPRTSTDRHGNTEDIIKDNIDNLRPNQYYLGAKRSRLLTTDEHGFARKHEIYILGSVKVSGVQWLKYNRGKMFLGGGYTNHGRARICTETWKYRNTEIRKHGDI